MKRKRHHKRAAAILAGTLPNHAATVGLDHFPHHRKADAKTTLAQRDGVRVLDEQIEDVRQRLRRDADAVVRHRDDDSLVHDVRGQGHHSAVRGVLRSDVQQVAENLHQSDRIAFHLRSRQLQLQQQCLMPRVHARSACFDRDIEHAVHVDVA